MQNQILNWQTSCLSHPFSLEELIKGLLTNLNCRVDYHIPGIILLSHQLTAWTCFLSVNLESQLHSLWDRVHKRNDPVSYSAHVEVLDMGLVWRRACCWMVAVGCSHRNNWYQMVVFKRWSNINYLHALMNYFGLIIPLETQQHGTWGITYLHTIVVTNEWLTDVTIG